MWIDKYDIVAMAVTSGIVATIIELLFGGFWASRDTPELQTWQNDLMKSVASLAMCDERKIQELKQLHDSSIESINAAVRDSVSDLQQQISTAMREYISKELQKVHNPIKDMNNASSTQLEKLMSHIEVLATNISKRFNSVLDHQQKSGTVFKDLSLEQHKNMKSHIDEITTQSLKIYEALKHNNLVLSNELKSSLSGLAKITEEGRVAILEVLEDPGIKQSSGEQSVDRKYRADYPMLTLVILNIFLTLYYVKKTDKNRNTAVRHQHVS